MAGARSFVVKLVADTKELTAGFNAVAQDAEKAFGNVGNQVSRNLVPGFQKLAAVSAVAFTGLAAAAGLSIKAAIDAQAEQSRLAAILTTTGGATEAQVESLIAQADALEKVGVASAGNIITAQAQLATFDLQFETIQKLTPAITDYVIAEKGATATAEDFKSMTNGLAQALNGQFGALTRAGFVLDENTKALISNGTEAERAAAIVDVLNSTYGGFNETARQTVEGRLVALRNSFNALRTSIGVALLPIFEQLIGVFQRLADFLSNNTGLVIGLGTAFAVFTGIIITASLAMKLYAGAAAIATAANVAFGTSLKATGVGGIVLVIGLIVSAFLVAIQRSEGFRNAILKMINGVIGAFESFINTFVGVFNFLKQQIANLGPLLRLVGIDVSELGKTAEVSFGRVGSAAKDAAKQINRVGIETNLAAARLAAANLETGLVSVSQAQDKLATATNRVNQLRAQGLKGGTSIEALNQALKDQSAAQSVLNSLLGDTANKTGGASGATKEAIKPLEAYTSVLKSAQGASDSYSRAQRSVRDTTKSLTKANEDLVAAQQALLEAQQGGSSGEIGDAQRALAAAERGLTRSQFAQEQSIFAVADAERKLGEVRADAGSTAQDIREAEIALAEAKLRVVDQEDEQINSTRTLEAAQRDLRIATEGLREGDAELVLLQKAVTDAQDAQTRAHEANTDAIKAETLAVQEYQTALDLLATAIINFPKVAARIGSPDLVPIVPIPPGTGGRFGNGGGGQRNMSDKVEITVNSSIVNPLQVAQEIQDYLDQLQRAYGTYAA